jgi:hypothetical protein
VGFGGSAHTLSVASQAALALVTQAAADVTNHFRTPALVQR